MTEQDAMLSVSGADEPSGFWDALVATVSSDAEKCWVGSAARRGWLDGALDPATRVSDLADTAHAGKVVLYGAGRLGTDLSRLAECPDVRIFWEHADSVLQTTLLEQGFRLYAIADSDTRWERRDDAGDPVELLYAVRRAGARAVCIVTHWGGLMGGQRSHQETVESLVRQGHMVDTVIPSDEGLGGLLRRVGGTVTLVEPLPWWYERVEVPQSAGAPATVEDLDPPHPVLLQELTRRRPDVVMTQCGLTPQGATAAAVLAIPHVWYLREYGDIDLGCRLPGSPEQVGAAIAALSTRVATNSRGVRDYFFPGRPEAATVVYPAPVLPGPHAIRTSWAERMPGVFSVGILASLQPGKGQTTLIEAAALLRGRGVDIRVRLYGSGSPQLRGQVEDAVRAHGVDDLVDFAGLEPSRLRMFSSLDAVVVASTAEAFGRVPFEAAAFDVPVVYADAAGPSEYMRDGITGLAFEPRNATALADAIERLVHDPALRERLAKEARADLVSTERLRTLDRQLHELISTAADEVGPTPERQAWGARLTQRLLASLGLTGKGTGPVPVSSAQETGSVRT